MRAVVATAFGPPEVLSVEERPDPQPGPGQAVVDVEFCDVGTLDRLVREGWGREFFDVSPPYVPGDGVGGTVRAVGPDVDRGWVGRRVVGGTGPRGADGLSSAPTGGYAELAVVDTRALVAVPDGLGLDTATALLNDGPTSQQLVAHTQPQPGDTALVLAAAGAGGVLVVQLAAARGATVVAAARGDAKVAALRSLGVEHVLDYGQPDWAAQVRAVVPDGPTVLFDGAGAALGAEAFVQPRDGARVVSYGSSAGAFAELDADEAERRGISVTGLFDLPALTAEDRARLVRQAFAAASEGVAIPLVAQVPLADAARAHSALRDRTAIGKTLPSTHDPR